MIYFLVLIISPRWTKVWRDLWSNKTRTLLVLLSIGIGVTAIGMVLGSRVIVDENLPAAYAAANPASGTLFTLTTFDDNMVKSIASMKEVSEAEGRRLVNIRFLTKTGEWRNLQLNAFPDFDQININKIKPEAGLYPPPRKTMLIERASLAASLGLGDVAIGDSILVEAPNGKQREIEIAGTVHDISQLPAFLNGAGYGYISFDTLEWMGEPRDFNQVVYVVADHKLNQDHITEVGKAIEKRLERAGVSVLFTLIFPPGEHPAQNFINALSFLLGAVGILSLVLSGFLIINTISAILTQQVRQIGIMKAVGGRTRQISGMYVVMVLGFGLMALAFSVPLGALGAIGISTLFAGFLNFDIGGIQLQPWVVGVQVVLSLIAPLVAASVPIIKGVRVTVSEAISEHGLGKGRFGRGRFDRLTLLASRVLPIGRPEQISLRNTFRRKARLILTLITLSLASTIFISIFSVRASLMQTLDEALNYFDYDVQVVFERPYRTQRIFQPIGEIAGVEGVESWGFASTRRVRPDETESDSFIVYAPKANTTMLNPILVEGRWLREDDTHAIVLSTDVLRNEKDLGVGSVVKLNLNGKKSDWEVVGIVRGVLFATAAFIDFDAFARATQTAGKAQISLVRLADRSPENQLRVGQLLEDTYRQQGFRVQQMQTIGQARSIISVIFNVIIAMLLFMALLLGAVGGLGLMGTMSINVLERTREIGVMRAIGASDRAVLQIVLLEGLLIGLISWLIGGLIALPASNLLTNAVGRSLLQAAPSYIFSTSGTILWLGIVLLLALLASYLPARSASRLTVRAALSYE
ncbi:MAG: ABC transporter permease [Caldilineaceae bacterium]